MATIHKSTAQGHADVCPPKSKSTRNKSSTAKQKSLDDGDNKITPDKNKKFKKKKKKEKTSDSEKKQSNKSSREEAHNREDSSSPLNSGCDTDLTAGDRQPDPKGSSSSNTSTQKPKGSKGSKRSKKSKSSSVSSEDAQAAATLGPAAVGDQAKEEEEVTVSAEALESLRWVGVLDDPVAEAHRLEVYKANRRKRYIAARQLQLGKAASLLTQP